MDRSYFTEWFLDCMFWGVLAVLGMLFIWEFFEMCSTSGDDAGEGKAGKDECNHTEGDADETPRCECGDEWEKLSDEEKEYLRRFFK